MTAPADPSRVSRARTRVLSALFLTAYTGVPALLAASRAQLPAFMWDRIAKTTSAVCTMKTAVESAFSPMN
jgi:hypothetical protein